MHHGYDSFTAAVSEAQSPYDMATNGDTGLYLFRHFNDAIF